MTATPPLLLHLAEHTGIAPLTLDDSDCCALRFGEELTVTFRWLPEDERLVMFTLLDALPLEGRAARLTELLRANFFWKGTGDATLSIDNSEPPRVLLAQRIEARHTTAVEFVQAVEWFVDSAGTWRQQLRGRRPEPTVPASSLPVMPSFA